MLVTELNLCTAGRLLAKLNSVLQTEAENMRLRLDGKTELQLHLELTVAELSYAVAKEVLV